MHKGIKRGKKGNAKTIKKRVIKVTGNMRQRRACWDINKREIGLN